MATTRKPETEQPEIRVTVDGGEFYSFVRALKRGWHSSDLGQVVLSVHNGKLTIESVRGGCQLSCNDAASVVARLTGKRFLQLVHLATDAKATGPLVIVFAPALGEVRLPNVGAKAIF